MMSDFEMRLPEMAAMPRGKRPERVLTEPEAALVAASPETLARVIGCPTAHWAGSCHSVSHALVRSGEFGRARVARGTAPGVGSQHSWIVLGDDCYDPEAVIVDPTIEWWQKLPDPEILVARAAILDHRPHGGGSIWEWGRPCGTGGPEIELADTSQLGEAARAFLHMLGPLDRQGWAMLAHAPVGGWPAKEIITAMAQTEEISALVPVDITGMITDLNPRGLYW